MNAHNDMRAVADVRLNALRTRWTGNEGLRPVGWFGTACGWTRTVWTTFGWFQAEPYRGAAAHDALTAHAN